ncbi:MAG: hypothetical protein JWO03_3126 [Bacteroidetes bacterium]|nr:hypothetical protein [Bacteroidota bacterium]
MKRLFTQFYILALSGISASAQSGSIDIGTTSPLNVPVTVEYIAVNTFEASDASNYGTGYSGSTAATIVLNNDTARLGNFTRSDNMRASAIEKRLMPVSNTFILVRRSHFHVSIDRMIAAPANTVYKINRPLTLINRIDIDMNSGIAEDEARITDKMLYASIPGELYTGISRGYLNKLTVLTTGLDEELSTNMTKSILLELTFIFNMP